MMDAKRKLSEDGAEAQASEASADPVAREDPTPAEDGQGEQEAKKAKVSEEAPSAAVPVEARPSAKDLASAAAAAAAAADYVPTTAPAAATAQYDDTEPEEVSDADFGVTGDVVTTMVFEAARGAAVMTAGGMGLHAMVQACGATVRKSVHLRSVLRSPWSCTLALTHMPRDVCVRWFSGRGAHGAVGRVRGGTVGTLRRGAPGLLWPACRVQAPRVAALQRKASGETAFSG